jgi:hypothetical protein
MRPSTATSAIASRMSGNDIMASTTRMIGPSSRRKYPAASPSTTPQATEIATTSAPIMSEYRAPKITRENTSRPSSSVPNQCAARGLCSRSTIRSAVGSYGVSQGAKAADKRRSPG